MRHYIFHLALSRDEIMLMYQGHANRLVVRTEQGLTLELGLEKIRPFVATNGVHGRFRLSTEDDHRFVRLERVN
ncbi:DUF2835 family protein [Aeromonas sp. NJAU223]|uniref:DUF2835 family protein n=1 Tax=Aeromonas sp. NJAU223 TaxID=3115650 RepID=UPI003DA8F0D9